MMKKIYNTPEINIIEQETEPFLYDTSIIQGDGWKPGTPIESKRTTFEDDDDWNGWD